MMQVFFRVVEGAAGGGASTGTACVFGQSHCRTL